MRQQRMALGRAGLMVCAALLALAGCSKSPTTPTGPGIPIGTTLDLAALIARSYPAGSELPTTLDTTANILAAIDVEGLRGAVAAFPVLGSGFITLSDAGAVSVRAAGEVVLDRQQLNVNGTVQTVYTSLASHPLGIALAFDGSTYQRFTIGGSSAVPASVDSVKSVAPAVISAPGAGATVSRSSNLTVSWSDAGTDSTVYMMVFVGSQVDTTKFAAAALTRDQDGSVTLAASQLAPLPNGAASMSVVRFRLVRRNLAGRKLDLISETVKLRALTLAN